MKIHHIIENKIKGVDGKACWPGKRYAGRKKKPDGTYKDVCVPVGESSEQEQVDEVSLGNYRNKASMSRGQSQMGAMFGNPEEKAKHLATFNKRDAGIARADARIKKQRAADQSAQLADLVARLPELRDEYEAMRAKYRSLGGSDWQYADREQNLTDREREARGMEGPMNSLWRQIQAAEKAQGQQGVAEGDISQLEKDVADAPVAPIANMEGATDSNGYSLDREDAGEYDYEGDQAKDQLQTIVAAARKLDGILDDNENMPEWVQMKITKATDYLDTAADYVAANKAQAEPMAEGEPEKIGGRHDPDDFDDMVSRLKKLAGSGPMKTVYDPNTRRYRNMPVAQQPKK